MTDEQGSRFGSNYEIGRRLGSGATGDVYLAQSADSEEPLAIKLLRRDLAEDDATVTRFLRERNIFKRLDHPNVVRIHDLVAEGNQLGIVMEYVPGGDLRQRVANHRLSNSQVVAIGVDLASGLEAIHAADVAHRDLKPANILLLEHGEQITPKITDFGISRLADSTMTELSTVMGTPLYMAPELANKQTVGPPADIYSLGCVIFELLTGATPFSGDTPMALIASHLLDSPPTIEGVPATLAGLIARMLGKAPSERPTAAQVRQELTELQPDIDDASTPRAVADMAATNRPEVAITPINEGSTIVRLQGDPAMGAAVAGPPPPATASAPSRRLIYSAAAAVVLLALGGVLWAVLRNPGNETLASESTNPASPSGSSTGASETTEASEPEDDEDTSTTSSSTTTTTPATTETGSEAEPAEQTLPATEPSVENPPTQPAETQPPETEPAVTKPAVTEPPLTLPPITRPPTPDTEPTPEPPALGGKEIIGNGNQCLDVGFQTFENGQNLWMWDCNGTIAQQWDLVDGQIRIQGMCLDIEGPSTREGALAQIWECQDVPQHQWRTTPSGEIISEYSNLCLDAAYGGTTRETPVHMWACNGSPAQRWQLP